MAGKGTQDPRAPIEVELGEKTYSLKLPPRRLAKEMRSIFAKIATDAAALGGADTPENIEAHLELSDKMLNTILLHPALVNDADLIESTADEVQYVEAMEALKELLERPFLKLQKRGAMILAAQNIPAAKKIKKR